MLFFSQIGRTKNVSYQNTAFPSKIRFAIRLDFFAASRHLHRATDQQHTAVIAREQKRRNAAYDCKNGFELVIFSFTFVFNSTLKNMRNRCNYFLFINIGFVYFSVTY